MQTREQKPAKKLALLDDLRRKPFRPILVEELRLLKPEDTMVLKHDLKTETVRMPITKDGYKTILQNALTFTETDSGLSLTFFEVGLFFKNGRLREYGASSSYRGIIQMLLANGLAEVHSQACRTWEEMARGTFDPNSYKNMDEQGWFHLIKPPPGLEDMLTEGQRDTLRYTGITRPFIYHDGFVDCYRLPEGGSMHTHTITHSDRYSYFPSPTDYNRYGFSVPVIWTIVDTAFIKQTLAEDSLSNKAKIKAIIDHHVDGMKDAVCVGVHRVGENLFPMVRE